MKAISLLSGGLDSILATRIIKDQGIDIIAVNFLTVFCNCTSKGKTCLASKSASDQLGVPLKVFEISSDYFEIIKNPKHGYGRNLNPCLDCRIFMFKQAKKYMEEIEASFIVTGEVLGERPMSQRKDAIFTIEEESGLKGYIVRPLSARLFKPSIPEQKGWVNRKDFFDIEGRSRKSQIQLASQFSINDYPCPAGGCLLTDNGFAKRLRDLMNHDMKFNTTNVKMLKMGRHFRITDNYKLIVGRDERENNILTSLAKKDNIYFEPINVTGPIGIGIGLAQRSDILSSASILARYCDRNENRKTTISYKKLPHESMELIEAQHATEETLSNYRI